MKDITECTPWCNQDPDVIKRINKTANFEVRIQGCWVPMVCEDYIGTPLYHVPGHICVAVPPDRIPALIMSGRVRVRLPREVEV